MSITEYLINEIQSNYNFQGNNNLCVKVSKNNLVEDIELIRSFSKALENNTSIMSLTLSIEPPTVDSLESFKALVYGL